MREYLEAYERMPYRGRWSTVRRPVAQPPLLIAALGPRMLELAATATDGTLPFFVSAERIAWMRGLLDEPRRPTARVRSSQRPWPRSWAMARLRASRLVPG